MPDKEEKTVNLDTSGPGARVELPETENEETKTYENKDNKNEANVIYDDQPADTSEKSSEQSNVRDEKNEGGEVAQKTDEVKSDKQQDNTQAVEEYSEGVKKRIAKLTKKMREAERQREEAIAFAQRVKQERDQFEAKSTSLDKNYATEMEGRISSSLTAAQEIGRTRRTREQGMAQSSFYSEALSDLGQAEDTLSKSLGASLALPTLEAQRSADVLSERGQKSIENVRKTQRDISESSGFASTGMDQDTIRETRKQYTRGLEDIDIALTKNLSDIFSNFEQQKFEMQSQRQQLEMQKRLADQQSQTRYFGLV